MALMSTFNSLGAVILISKCLQLVAEFYPIYISINKMLTYFGIVSYFVAWSVLAGNHRTTMNGLNINQLSIDVSSTINWKGNT